MSKRIITLGTWEGKPIEWLVLKEEGFATWVVSKYALFNYCFNPNISDGNNWYNSALRRYLNYEFYKQAFNENEKKKVINTKLTDVNTKDNIFVLSKDEVNNSMLNDERKCDYPWLLRSPWKSGENTRVLRILGDGRFSLEEYGATSSCDVNNFYGIRPAMWIKEK